MTIVRGKKKKGPPEIPVGSFSDIAFLLIIFFIVATTLQQITGILADIPAGEKSEAQTKTTTTIQLHHDKIMFNEEKVDVSTLRKRLRKLKLRTKKGDEKIVLLEATGNVSYQTYFDAMTAISSSGGVMAIVSEEKKKGKGK